MIWFVFLLVKDVDVVDELKETRSGFQWSGGGFVLIVKSSRGTSAYASVMRPDLRQ